ncbi:MAG: 3-aminobutyryl-CoA aminotransferase [Verrucomicrobiota bacterium]|jgi:glutamate-1-semialdehyde aminotransferase
MSDPRYAKSNAFFERALQSIPLASQTFSKSHLQYPKGHAPLFMERGAGARLWDIDGNEYVDLVSSLLPILFGYCDPDVDAAIRDQLAKGIIFSMPSTLEAEVAELLIDIIPCAEKVRFGKNGSDATSAAIRLARAFTHRDRVAVCGYHGWQDWYIGSTTRKLGVPDAVCALTHSFVYNDLDSLDALFHQHPGEFAAVIMEPANAAKPKDGFLHKVKELCARHGALLIFDEVIAGFRFANGGAQELFGVTPDLAAFGKALGNGMPISAVVGRADVMAKMDDIFFSGTAGGEALSLAAAKAVLLKVKREPVVDTLWSRGREVAGIALEAARRHGLEHCYSLTGLPPWQLIVWKDAPGASAAELKTFFIRRMLAKGIMINSSHNVSYALGDAEVAKIAAAYNQVFEEMAAALSRGELPLLLGCAPIQPIFKVR